MTRSIIKGTLFYIALASIVMSILIPLSYLVTISFSNLIELSDFPKRMLPSFSETLTDT